MPNNEGWTEVWEETFSNERGSLEAEGDSREGVHTCWTCSALVTYWRRREHYAWHQSLVGAGGES